MSYSLLQKYLEDNFKKNDFGKSLSLSQFNSKFIKLETCENHSIISVSFPGYKSKFKGSKIIYDYRIDLDRKGKETSLSHSNILVDIYNKILHGKIDAEKLSDVLMELSQTGRIEIKKVKTLLNYRPTPPTPQLLKLVKQYHGSKYYNELGNKIDLDLEELLYSIKWIVIQEDINYPISQGFEGRRMCFSRYLECIHLTQEQNSHTFEELIKRTLSHKRPKPWSEMDYSFKEKIK
ncbi:MULTISPECIES: hypothetical protein [unclassified Lentimicrobium]|uniref:hypothetical protein n=1 Tax=unclassified Lentimicrobium TaxID=2677434 RepID=UPI00155745C5|nr:MULTISPECIES: hypothetical protein [unclassified Lentimicrobium]NPD47708.1 hypothetical protein [Lentimicrobium sp. S6]NPD83892.1 hypothetical protein [Lentimicrobium sp. L6]